MSTVVKLKTKTTVRGMKAELERLGALFDMIGPLAKEAEETKARLKAAMVAAGKTSLLSPTFKATLSTRAMPDKFDKKAIERDFDREALINAGYLVPGKGKSVAMEVRLNDAAEERLDAAE